MKSGIVVLARSGASRRPGKMTADVCGQPLLARVFERVLRASVDVRVLATTCLVDEQPLVDLARSANIHVYRGSEDDLIERMLGAYQTFGIDAGVIVEADELFSDPQHIQQLVEHLVSEDSDCAKLKNIPIGSWVVGVRRSALEKLFAERKYKTTEAWSRFFFESGRFDARWLDPDPPLPVFDSALRLTIDYEEDLKLADTIYAEIGDVQATSLVAVVSHLNRHPELIQINCSRNEMYWARIKERSQ